MLIALLFSVNLFLSILTLYIFIEILLLVFHSIKEIKLNDNYILYKELIKIKETNLTISVSATSLFWGLFYYLIH